MEVNSLFFRVSPEFLPPFSLHDHRNEYNCQNKPISSYCFSRGFGERLSAKRALNLKWNSRKILQTKNKIFYLRLWVSLRSALTTHSSNSERSKKKRKWPSYIPNELPFKMPPAFCHSIRKYQQIFLWAWGINDGAIHTIQSSSMKMIIIFTTTSLSLMAPQCPPHKQRRRDWKLIWKASS